MSSAVTMNRSDTSDLKKLTQKMLGDRSHDIDVYLSHIVRQGVRNGLDITNAIRAHDGNISEALIELGFPVNQRVVESIKILQESNSWVKGFFEGLYSISQFDRERLKERKIDRVYLIPVPIPPDVPTGGDVEKLDALNDIKASQDGDEKPPDHSGENGKNPEETTSTAPETGVHQSSNYHQVMERVQEEVGNVIISSADLISLLVRIYRGYGESEVVDQRKWGGIIGRMVRDNFLKKVEGGYQIKKKSVDTEIFPPTPAGPDVASDILRKAGPLFLDQIKAMIEAHESERQRLEEQCTELQRQRALLYGKIQRLKCAGEVISEISQNVKEI